jgi:uncharacterized membrane protein YesL
MGGYFKLDSPFMKLLTLVTNLVCLNVLWLLCCLPIFTAGASTVAMYHVIIQYVTHQDDAVMKPFFKAFKDNFKATTPIWILNFLIALALAAEAFYLSQGADNWLIVAFLVLAFAYLGISSYLYPIIARYDVPVRNAVFNSIALSLRHFGSTVLVVSLNLLPIVLSILEPQIFLRTGILWTLGGFSLIAYLNCRILMKVFKKYEHKDEHIEE